MKNGNIKRVLSILMVLALMCGTLAGCGGSSQAPAANQAAPQAGTDTAAPTETAGGEAAEGAVDVNEDGTVNNPEDVKVDANDLVLWSLFSGGDGKFMDQIVADYNAQTEGRKVTSIMLVWADYYTKLITAVAANKGPDIGISHVSKLPELVSQGVIVPFDAEADAVGVDWSVFDNSILESVTFDGGKYAMPLDTHAEIMYFNKDLIEQAGLTLNNGRLDFGSGEAGFRSTIDQLKAGLPEGVSAFSFPSKGDDPYRIWWATYFQMGGTPLVSEDGSSVTMDPAIAEKAMDFLKSLYDDGSIPSGIEDAGKYFQGGQGALFYGGTWSTGSFEGQSGFNFGAQAYPTIFGKPACWADAHTMIIPFNKNRDDDKTKAAVDFINFVTGEGGLTWAGSGQIPSNNNVLNSSEYKAMPFRSDYAEAAKDAVYPSSNENFGAIKDLLIKNLDTVWNGSVSSADAVQSILSEMETAIS